MSLHLQILSFCRIISRLSFDILTIIEYLTNDQISPCVLWLSLALAAGSAWVPYLTCLARCLHDEKCSVGSSHDECWRGLPELNLHGNSGNAMRYELKLLVVMALAQRYFHMKIETWPELCMGTQRWTSWPNAISLSDFLPTLMSTFFSSLTDHNTKLNWHFLVWNDVDE